MAAQPTVSVIIPFYNNACHLQEAVHSAVEQTLVGKEIIVVDDGCNDNSAEHLADYLNQITLIKQSNQGVSAARNTGLDHAKGEYVAFLDADDYWDPTFLEKMVSLARQNQAEICYCGWQHVGAHRDLRPFIPRDYEAMPNKRHLFFESSRWPIHAALISRPLLQSIHGFEAGRRFCEDFKIWLQLALDRPVHRLPEVLAFYRHHSDEQSTANRAEMIRQHFYVQQEFIKQNRVQLAGISNQELRQLSVGYVLKRAYNAYWGGDLMTARTAFRQVMRQGFGMPKDWFHMLPSLLPLACHRLLLSLWRRNHAK